MEQEARDKWICLITTPNEMVTGGKEARGAEKLLLQQLWYNRRNRIGLEQRKLLFVEWISRLSRCMVARSAKLGC